MPLQMFFLDVVALCKKHWKVIDTALIVIVAIVGLVILSMIPGGE